MADEDPIAQQLDTVKRVVPLNGVPETPPQEPADYARNRRREEPGSGVAANPQILPFDMVDVSTDDDVLIRVAPGTLAGVSPSGFSPGDSPQYILGPLADGSYILYGVVQWDATGEVPGDLQSCDLGFESTVPADDQAECKFHYRIGSVSVSGGMASIANERRSAIPTFPYRDWYLYPKTFKATNQ